jgi:hypothetical protein
VNITLLSSSAITTAMIASASRVRRESLRSCFSPASFLNIP